MGYSSDRAPHIGSVPGRPGMFIMSGFTGHGMPQVFLCAEGIAKMVTGKSQFSDTGVPRLFETSQRRLDSVSDLIKPKDSTKIASKL
jgi:glycine/D-amino acid oxidase-like deaminating enzyme